MSNYEHGRAYNLRGVYHLLARVAPFWIGVVVLSGIAVSILFVLAALGGDSSLLVTFAFLVVFWTVGVLLWWPSLGSEASR